MFRMRWSVFAGVALVVAAASAAGAQPLNSPHIAYRLPGRRPARHHRAGESGRPVRGHRDRRHGFRARHPRAHRGRRQTADTEGTHRASRQSDGDAEDGEDPGRTPGTRRDPAAHRRFGPAQPEPGPLRDRDAFHFHRRRRGAGSAPGSAGHRARPVERAHVRGGSGAGVHGEGGEGRQGRLRADRHAAGRRQRAPHSGRRRPYAVPAPPTRAVRTRRHRSLSFRGPQGAGPRLHRQRPRPDALSGRRCARLDPGDAHALRRVGPRDRLRRRLPLSAGPGPPREDPGRRGLRAGDQGRALPRPRGLRLPDRHRRVPVHHERIPARRAGRIEDRRPGDRMESAGHSSDDGCDARGAWRVVGHGNRARTAGQPRAVRRRLAARDARARTELARRRTPSGSRSRSSSTDGSRNRATSTSSRSRERRASRSSRRFTRGGSARRSTRRSS